MGANKDHPTGSFFSRVTNMLYIVQYIHFDSKHITQHNGIECCVMVILISIVI